MPTDSARLKKWLTRYQMDMPAAILAETYRPLAFLAGQIMLACAPLLPIDRMQQWGEGLSQWDKKRDDPTNT